MSLIIKKILITFSFVSGADNIILDTIYRQNYANLGSIFNKIEWGYLTPKFLFYNNFLGGELCN